MSCTVFCTEGFTPPPLVSFPFGGMAVLAGLICQSCQIYFVPRIESEGSISRPMTYKFLKKMSGVAAERENVAGGEFWNVDFPPRGREDSWQNIEQR